MKKSEDNLILVKSKAFALRIIRLYKYLCEEKKEFVLSKQVLRSSTCIGANAMEASFESIYAENKDLITSILKSYRSK